MHCSVTNCSPLLCVVIRNKRSRFISGFCFCFRCADNSAIIISSRIIEEERNSIIGRFVVPWLLATNASAWYSPLIDCWVHMVLLLVSTNDCVAFYYSEAFLLNSNAVTAGDVILFYYFILCFLLFDHGYS